MAAKLSISLEEDHEENGLKRRHKMFIAMFVYVVFQLSLLGSLLSSSCSHFRSACNTPHFYLSIVASLFTIITLLLAYLVEDMQKAAPPYFGRREDFQMAALPCYGRREDIEKAVLLPCYRRREDIEKAALPCYGRMVCSCFPVPLCFGRREDMQKAAPPCYGRRVGECFHVALYPLLVYTLISMR